MTSNLLRHFSFSGCRRRNLSVARTSVRIMSSAAASDREEILATYAEWETVNAKVGEQSLDALTHTELLGLQHRRES